MTRFVLLLCVVLTGCEWKASRTAGARPKPSAEPEHEHDPDDVPITEADVEMPTDFNAAVERMRDYSTKIKTAILAGTPSKAHRPLDELDIVIGKVMPIARDSGVPRTDWEQVNLARRDLRAQFDVLHAAIDGGEKPDWSAAEPGVETALASLESVAAKAAK
jgi:hypothetical protein